MQVIDGALVTVGEVAHIHAQSTNGPRYRQDLLPEDVDSAANCLLLCPDHHKAIDRGRPLPDAEVLQGWKRRHEGKVARARASLTSLAFPKPVPEYQTRDELTTEIECGLAQVHAVVLAGLSGNGKTQIAADYAMRTQRHRHVWWLRGTTLETLDADTSALGRDLGVDRWPDEDPIRYAGRILSALASSEAGLLVIDDLADEVLPLLQYVTSSLDLIITSKSQSWPGYPVVRIPIVDAQVGRGIFRSITGRVVDSEIEDAILDLCAGSPLAIAQSASYLDETGMDAGRFLGLFAASRARLLDRGKLSGHGGLAASVRLSREALDGTTRSVLDLLAVLGPGPFPIVAMPELQTLLPALGDDLALEDHLASLRKFSLIERGPKGVALHELVRDIAREVQGANERRSAVVLAAAALHVLVPEDPSRDADLVEFDSVAGHVDAVLGELRGEAAIAPPFTGWLANKFGLYLQARGQDRRAETVFRSAIEVVERGRDEDRYGLGSLYHNLGTILQDDDNLDGAEDAFKHALDLKQREDADSLPAAITLSSLAMVQWKRGNYAEARQLLERALLVYEREGDVPRAADALQDLAGIIKTADPAAALRQLRESVTLARTAAVAWPEVCIGLGRIAEVHEDDGDFDAALGCLDEAVEISRANLANHRLASALAQRSHLRAVRGELPEAIADGEEALSVMVMVEPAGGLGSGRRRGDLGIVHFQAGNLDRAVDLVVESYTEISRLVRRGHHSEVIAFGILCRALDFCAGRPDLLARLVGLLEAVGEQEAHD